MNTLPSQSGKIEREPQPPEERNTQGTPPEEGSTMAIILSEEVLMGLDDVKASLEQVKTVLDVLVDDLSPALGRDYAPH